MMANYSAVAADLRRLVTFFQGLNQAADFLENAEKIQQTIDGYQVQIDKDSKALAKLNVAIVAANEKIRVANEQAESIVADASAKAENIVANACESAQRLIKEGQEKSDQIVAAAASELAGVKARMAQDVETLGISKDALEAKVAELTEAIDAKTAAAEVAEARLAKVQAQIKKLAEG